jgi:hypothetical protein
MDVQRKTGAASTVHSDLRWSRGKMTLHRMTYQLLSRAHPHQPNTIALKSMIATTKTPAMQRPNCKADKRCESFGLLIGKTSRGSQR